MTDILLRISSYSSKELSEMWTTCRELYKDNQIQLDYIDELEKTYKACKVGEYYTGNSCLSRAVHQACHTGNMKQIFTFRVYVSDLHKQLVEYYEEDDNRKDIQKLYRGKPLSGSVLQQLIDNEGELVSMNGFLSTTIMNEVASFYHGDDQIRKVNEGFNAVLFVLEISTRIKQPYAYIGPHSTKKDEAEVLFSPGTIWRIKSVQLSEGLCIIELTSCDELDSQSTELLKKYTINGCNLSSVVDILLELGNDEEAEWFYNKMLKQDSLDKNSTRGNLYSKIGKIRLEKKDSFFALETFKKAALFLLSSINESDQIRAARPLYMCDNQSLLITIYNNMGLIHEKDGEFKEAIQCYKQALEVKHGSESEIATVHNNLGLLYYRLLLMKVIRRG